LEAISRRQEIFESRIEVISVLAEYFHTPISDIDALSPEEFQKLFEVRETRVKEHNERLKAKK
jgi:hypothetical protein